MYKIKEARRLAPAVKLFRIEAPRIAKKRIAGQFVILRVHERGERIPLTIVDSDVAAGTITIIVQGVGKTTNLLNMLATGDSVLDLVGPLGKPSDIRRFGTVVLIGGGVGTAIAYPIAVAMKHAGNCVVGIIGARSKGLIILEDEMRATCDELFVMTDDGSYAQQGFVTQSLQKFIDDGREINRVLAIGPIPMMRAVAEVTRPHGISTVVSLNPIMVDGTGMCGGCRVLVGGDSKFACVDGPEFNAFEVDFDSLMQRNALYHSQEQAAMKRLESHAHEEFDAVRRCRLREQYPEVNQLCDDSDNETP